MRCRQQRKQPNRNLLSTDHAAKMRFCRSLLSREAKEKRKPFLLLMLSLVEGFCLSVFGGLNVARRAPANVLHQTTRQTQCHAKSLSLFLLAALLLNFGSGLDLMLPRLQLEGSPNLHSGEGRKKGLVYAAVRFVRVYFTEMFHTH
jgi:hypothetical protein